MPRWKNPPLNSGALLALGLGGECFLFAGEVHSFALTVFLLWLGVTGFYYAWYSLKRFGLWIR